MTVLKHQNTETALYKLPKNHWVIALVYCFASVRKKTTCDSFFGSRCIFFGNDSSSGQFPPAGWQLLYQQYLSGEETLINKNKF